MDNRKEQLLVDIKKNCQKVEESMRRAYEIAEASAAEGKLNEVDLEMMLETIAHFVGASEQLERGAKGLVDTDSKVA